MMLVTLARTRTRLKYDTTDFDADITFAIEAASRSVVTYLQEPSFADTAGDIPVDTAGIAIDVPEDVQTATIMLAGYFLRQPDRDAVQEWQMGFLPAPVTALLFPYRAPTLA
jgi:hypothetical protein